MESEQAVSVAVMLIRGVAAAMAIVATVALVLNAFGLVHSEGTTRMVLVMLAVALSIGVGVATRQAGRGRR
jgi:hypothetical protein